MQMSVLFMCPFRQSQCAVFFLLFFYSVHCGKVSIVFVLVNRREKFYIVDLHLYVKCRRDKALLVVHAQHVVNAFTLKPTSW